ncbi:MAG: hypothetical protein ACLR17_02930 [Enterobacteriaceae bacterium]
MRFRCGVGCRYWRLRRTLSYPRLLISMLALLRQEKVLQVRGVLALLMFAAFNIFWSALVLPLSAPPFRFSHTEIGALGLVGVIGALAAGRAGKWADRGYGQRTSAAALVMLLIAWWPLSLMAWCPRRCWSALYYWISAVRRCMSPIKA